MRPPRRLLLLGLFLAMAAVCWTKCCRPHLRRWRRLQATGTSPTGGRPGRWCAALVAVLLCVAALAVPVPAAGVMSMTVTTQTLPDGALRVTATVTGPGGTPVPDVPVLMRAKTTFGWLKVVEKATDARGQVAVELSAPSRFEEIRAEAGDAETVQAAVRFERGQPAVPSVRPGYDRLAHLSPQPGFISPYPVPVQVLLLGLILGGIWATYGYIVSLLVQMRRTG